MWIKRDFETYLAKLKALPIKVLKGPRQVGKTSLLGRVTSHQIVYLDDIAIRSRALENPRLFLDSLPPQLILDEASLAPPLFSELKRRVDEQRRSRDTTPIDIWITGSNQTLLQRSVQESLAGRASYFDLNTLSIHELGQLFNFGEYFFRGGWPELYVSSELDPVRYLNDLIATFIEKDIIAAAGIERKAAFIKTLQLTAARVAQLFDFSNIATNVGADLTTVQSWLTILETNGILRRLAAFSTNLNQRLIKAPKFIFEDVSLATRLQGWTEKTPLQLSPVAGSLLENMAISEVCRFFINRGEQANINYVRSKEKVEIDLIVHLPNQRVLAIEVKSTPEDFSREQIKLLDTLGLNIVERWVISPTPATAFKASKVVLLQEIWQELNRLD